jgi:hypothetical protein
MADPNHVRVLVAAGPSRDDPHFNDDAIAYYNAYKFEPSKAADDDMIIDDVVDVTGGGQRHISFMAVMEALIQAAQAGFLEVLLVAHGNPLGLIMDLGVPGMGAANKNALAQALKLEDVLNRVATIKAMSDPVAKRREWRKLYAELADKPFGNGKFGPDPTPTLQDNEPNDVDAEQILNDMAPSVAGASILKNRDLLRLLALRKQVVGLGLKRLEIRACNMGQDPDGLKVLRNFIGTSRLLAPVVFTFFSSPLTLNILVDRDFRQRVGHIPAAALASNTPIRWFRCGLAQVLAQLSGPGPGAVSYPPQAQGAPDVSCFLRYANNTLAGFAWGTTPQDARCIRLFVYELLDPYDNLRYQSGPFRMGGFDALRDRTAPPSEANNKALVIPSDAEYRNLIKGV